MRPDDQIRVECDLGTLDRFTSVEITQDLTAPTQAAFELGDDHSWLELRDFVSLGREYRVVVNNRQILRGRIEARDVPFDAGGGASVRFTIRTKLADAMYASANHGIKLGKNAKLKDMLLALYEPLGYAEKDFVFDADVSRNLITGKSETTGKSPPNFEPLQPGRERVEPGAGIYQVASDFLRAHGFMHWDSPDGKIVVSEPNDTQAPTYHFFARSGPSADANNLISISKIEDWSDMPTIIGVYSTKKNVPSASYRNYRGVVKNEEMLGVKTADGRDAFYRPTVIVANGLTKDQAEARARRELSARSKQKDAFEISVDGLSHWDGARAVNYAVDTVAEVDSNVLGVESGNYYVHRVTMRRDPQGGDTTSLTTLRKGIWVV